MYRLVILIFLFASCSNTDSKVINKVNQFDNLIHLPVVEKRVINSHLLSEDFEFHFVNIFDRNIKLSGYEGIASFTILNYTEETNDIEKGREILIEISLETIIEKKDFQKKIIINANQNGNLIGNFSLKDFDELISATQIKLINKLMKELDSQF